MPKPELDDLAMLARLLDLVEALGRQHHRVEVERLLGEEPWLADARTRLESLVSIAGTRGEPEPYGRALAADTLASAVSRQLDTLLLCLVGDGLRRHRLRLDHVRRCLDAARMHDELETDRLRPADETVH